MTSKQKIEKEIQSITSQLVEKYKPEKIILFGSAAWGKLTPDSDLDFMIIKDGVPQKGTERMREVRFLVDTSFPCDFLVAKPQEIKQRLEWEDPFIEQIMGKGRILYG